MVQEGRCFAASEGEVAGRQEKWGQLLVLARTILVPLGQQVSVSRRERWFCEQGNAGVGVLGPGL